VRALTKKQQDKSILKKLNMGNMKKFHKSEKIKQVALMAIAVQSDPTDIEDLKKIFQELDKDGNGSITLEELQLGLGDRENSEDLIEILKGADTDKSGAINYTGK
jgi:calcium-dependent protein kinase